MGRRLCAAVLTLFAGGALATPATAYDPVEEARNFSRIGQRIAVEHPDPSFQAASAQRQVADMQDILARDLGSGGERFSGSLCGSGTLTCSGDPRLYGWAPSKGTQRPIRFANRNGAIIEGNLWLGRAGAEAVARGERLPGIVLQTGSVQAPERWYMWAAQVLAAHGYLVLTTDVQGQGRSDLMGARGPHAFDGFPAQDQGHFVEDLTDALDFMVSTGAAPYRPRTVHGTTRHNAAVAKGTADRANPHAAALDASRIGIVGHSLGAASVSVVQQTDPRVDAIVAWDGLSANVTPKVPALGMSADYLIVPTPNLSDPDPATKGRAVARWAQAGVDAMEVVIRGGSHFEWSYAPNLLPATLRGIDAAAWYTTAWFDRYVKGDASADDRLLTDRWRTDPIDAALDPPGAGNLHSALYRSPVAIKLAGGTPFACTDLRTTCALRPGDGLPRTTPYSYLQDRG